VNTAAPAGDQVLYLGLLGASRGIIFLLYITLGGAIADRYPRRTVVIISSLSTVGLLLLVDLLLWIPAIGGSTDTVIVVALIGLFATFGLSTAQDQPTRTSMVRDAVPDHLLGGGIALFQLAQGAMVMAAAPLAGILIDRFGIPTTYLVGVLGPVAVVLLIRRLPRDIGASDPDAATVSLIDNLRGGFSVIRDDPVVRWTVLLSWITTMLGLSILGVLVAAWASEVLGLDASGWGRMIFFWGFGSFVAATYLSTREIRRHRGWFFLGSSFVFSLAVIGFSLSREMPLVYFFNALNGGAFIAFTIAGLAIVQNTVPNRVLGRVTGLLLLGQGLMQVFALLVSVVARAVGLEAVFLGIAITMLGTTTLVAAVQHPLRSFD
ncbi:MAG: MFS transporter, partial [Dehalococcoidia bacterium]